ncbi:hypothetical protein Baya_12475 [Bagarius yarrelli]|uniref:Uncharacterized protein n=1 Tax=Bagarius yarrelli TaxID=175774 RepID=A0A556V3J3_BAGYA|nr:hypothetical protein Baya_12475 [Bagarius yarrelli]
MLGTSHIPLRLGADSAAVLVGATHPFNDGVLSRQIQPAPEKSGDNGGADVCVSQISTQHRVLSPLGACNPENRGEVRRPDHRDAERNVPELCRFALCTFYEQHDTWLFLRTCPKSMRNNLAQITPVVLWLEKPKELIQSLFGPSHRTATWGSTLKLFPLPSSSCFTELATYNGKNRHIHHSQSPASGYSHLLIAPGDPQVPHNEHAAGKVGGLDRIGKVLGGHFGWGIACLLERTEKEEEMVSQGCQTSFTLKLKLQCKRTDPQLELIHTHNDHTARSGREKTRYFDLPRAESKANKAADKRSR